MYQKKVLDTTAENDASQKIILLVDDDDDEHEIFLSALKHANKSCSFISADSCEEAMKILKETEPDYIFIDVNMPRTNGMICLEQIKKISKIAHIPVYMYSTGMNARDGQRALQLGAVDYIIKPNSISTLSTLLKKILN
ncbi:MAG TPA: response regulator [Parafilimonas sp.]|jgi:DNA-binding NtrC family response regulator